MRGLSGLLQKLQTRGYPRFLGAQQGMGQNESTRIWIAGFGPCFHLGSHSPLFLVGRVPLLQQTEKRVALFWALSTGGPKPSLGRQEWGLRLEGSPFSDLSEATGDSVRLDKSDLSEKS